jgi:hypothetical protein
MNYKHNTYGVYNETTRTQQPQYNQQKISNNEVKYIRNKPLSKIQETYKYINFGIIQKLRKKNINYRKFIYIKKELRSVFDMLISSIKHLNNLLDDDVEYVGDIKKNRSVIDKPNKKNNNDVRYLKENIELFQVKSMNVIERYRPHLTPIVENLFREYNHSVNGSLYDLLASCNYNKMVLSTYKPCKDKIIIIGDVNVKDNYKIFVDISKYFGMTLPSSYSVLNRLDKYKDLKKLLDKIKFCCDEYMISRTDKTKRPVVVDSKIYFKENERHFDKKYKFIGKIDDIVQLEGQKDLYIDIFKNETTSKYHFPTPSLLFKEHKDKLVILDYEDKEIIKYDYVPTRQIVSYPHSMSLEWSDTLHLLAVKLTKNFSTLVLKNDNYKHLRLVMLKDSFNLVEYMNNLNYNVYSIEDFNDYVYSSIYKTYDVCEMYDNLDHSSIIKVINRCVVDYKIINEVDKELILLHLKTLFVRLGDYIFKQIKGLPMGGHLSPILSMILIFDICIRYVFDNIVLFVDDFKLLFSNGDTVERFRRIIELELGLSITLNSNDKMLECNIIDDDLGFPVFCYDINQQRRHLNNNILSIPNTYRRYDDVCSTNVNIAVIKGYINKIDKMSILPHIFINNHFSLMVRCFNSGQLMNYILSRRNRLKYRKNRVKLLYKEIGLVNKETNRNIVIEEIDEKIRYRKKVVLLLKKLSRVLVDIVDGR